MGPVGRFGATEPGDHCGDRGGFGGGFGVGQSALWGDLRVRGTLPPSLTVSSERISHQWKSSPWHHGTNRERGGNDNVDTV